MKYLLVSLSRFLCVCVHIDKKCERLCGWQTPGCKDQTSSRLIALTGKGIKALKIHRGTYKYT